MRADFLASLMFRPEFMYLAGLPQDPQSTQGQDSSFATKPRPGSALPPDGTGGLERQEAPQVGVQEGCMQQLWIILPMILIFYFLLIRPQQKQEKARQQMLASVKKGDRIITSGGIHGTVTQINDTTLRLRLDQEGKVTITAERSAVGRVLRDEEKKDSAT